MRLYLACDCNLVRLLVGTGHRSLGAVSEGRVENNVRLASVRGGGPVSHRRSVLTDDGMVPTFFPAIGILRTGTLQCPFTLSVTPSCRGDQSRSEVRSEQDNL